MRIHVAYTWLLANCLHPVVWSVYYMIFSPENLNAEEIGLLFLLFAISCIASLHCLLIGWLMMNYLLRHPMSALNKLFVLIAFVIILMILHAGVIMSLEGYIDMSALIGLMPATVAAATAILIRYKQFVRLASQTNSSPTIGQP